MNAVAEVSSATTAVRVDVTRLYMNAQRKLLVKAWVKDERKMYQPVWLVRQGTSWSIHDDKQFYPVALTSEENQYIEQFSRWCVESTKQQMHRLEEGIDKLYVYPTDLPHQSYYITTGAIEEFGDRHGLGIPMLLHTWNQAVDILQCPLWKVTDFDEAQVKWNVLFQRLLNVGGIEVEEERYRCPIYRLAQMTTC